MIRDTLLKTLNLKLQDNCKNYFYIFLGLMWCNVGFAFYIKCDISNIKLSDRVSEKNIKMYEKLKYFTFKDKVTKMNI